MLCGIRIKHKSGKDEVNFYSKHKVTLKGKPNQRTVVYERYKLQVKYLNYEMRLFKVSNWSLILC